MGAAPVELRLQLRRAQQGGLQEKVVPARAQPHHLRRPSLVAALQPCKCTMERCVSATDS